MPVGPVSPSRNGAPRASGRYPHLARLLAESPAPVDPDEIFALGIARLLDSFAPPETPPVTGA
ncbi:hypothetical protein [Streptomyces sp. NPDC048266]|uniref:hypothetical protein n=1 Tax=Streptomyces sp. NPDC048266 TaxID=3155787 RepID=UPI0033DFB3EF